MRDVTIIIPTLGLMERGPEIKRAVDSVLSQTGVEIRVLIVVNGNRSHPDVLRQFDGMDRVRVMHIPEPHLSLARLAGLDATETTYFGFLDDDDSILPEGIAPRVDAFEQDDSLAAVITNGYLEDRDGRAILYNDFLRYPDDPVRALIEFNWLASCGGLFRRAVIDRNIFTDLPKSMEMTLIAFRLAARHPILRIDVPTYVLHHHEHDRLSAAAHYKDNGIVALEAIYNQLDRQDIRRRIAERIGDAAHDLSVRALEQGQRGEAWRLHAKSLLAPGGFKYLSFTRHLLNPFGGKSPA